MTKRVMMAHRRQVIFGLDGVLYEDTVGMASPARHRTCGRVFDLQAVKTITARYIDCTVFVCPACGKQATDVEWRSDGVIRIERRHRGSYPVHDLPEEPTAIDPELDQAMGRWLEKEEDTDAAE